MKEVYQVIDRITGKIVGTYNNRRSAQNKRDKLDNQYGGYRYYVKAVEVVA